MAIQAWYSNCKHDKQGKARQFSRPVSRAAGWEITEGALLTYLLTYLMYGDGGGSFLRRDLDEWALGTHWVGADCLDCLHEEIFLDGMDGMGEMGPDVYYRFVYVYVYIGFLVFGFGEMG